MAKADPCLACGHLAIRRDTDPPPAVCPACGRDALLRPPTPTPLAALRASVRRRVLAIDGDTEGWS